MRHPLRLAALGDSSVAGIGAEHVDGCLGLQIAQRVADALGRPVHVSGYGVCGARTADVAAEQVPALAVETAPDAVIVAVGANDIVHLTPPPRYLSDVSRLYGALQHDPGAPVVACSLPEIRAVNIVGQPLRDVAAAYGRVLGVLQRRAIRRLPGVTWVDARRTAGPVFLREPDAMSGRLPPLGLRLPPAGGRARACGRRCTRWCAVTVVRQPRAAGMG